MTIKEEINNLKLEISSTEKALKDMPAETFLGRISLCFKLKLLNSKLERLSNLGGRND